MSQPVLVNYFPAVFCPVHDFPHPILAALTPLVPARDHKLRCCSLLWLRLARWGWQGWSPASVMGNRAACPACVPGAPRISSRPAVHRFVQDGDWEHWQLPGALFTRMLLLLLSVAELHWDIFGIKAEWKHII